MPDTSALVSVSCADSRRRDDIVAAFAAAFLPVGDGGVLQVLDMPSSGEMPPSMPLSAAAGPLRICLVDDLSAAQRVALLQAGADDVLPRQGPYDHLAARAARLIAARATREEALRACRDLPGFDRLTVPRILHIGPARPGLGPEMPGKRTRIDAADLAEADARDAPDLIILTDPAGPQILAALPAYARLRGAHVIASLTDPMRQAACLASGAVDAIPETASPAEWHLRVERILRRKWDMDQAAAALTAGLDLSLSDPLTGLRNRRFFDQRFQGLFGRARLLGEDLSVLVFDIDGFKQINDRFGHAAGDTILREFGRRLGANVRARDLVARYGGEEFVAATPQASLEVARRAAERVRAAIAAPGFQIGGGAATDVTVSVGIACLRPEDRRAEDLLARADAALFTAKGLGKNRVRCAA